MTIHLIGFQANFYLGLPLRLTGYAFLFFGVLALAGMSTVGRRAGQAERRIASAWRWGLLILLLAAAPVASQTFLVQIPAPDTLAAPGVPLEPPGPILSLFGALPWVIAAGFLGVWQAIAVGFVGGLATGGWETQSLLTPINLGLQAGFVALLLRQNYADLPGRIARQPIAAALLGGALFAALRLAELFAYSRGDVYDGLAFSFSRFEPLLVASLIEAGIGGVVGQGLKSAVPEAWFQPRLEGVGPYNRSLAARIAAVFLFLGVVASGVILYGDWLLARASAMELLEDRMSQTARQASQSVPYFILTGRAQIREFARSVQGGPVEQSQAEAEVAALARFAPYFNQILVFDSQAGLLWAAPPGPMEATDLELELVAAVEAALSGVPQEVVLPPETQGAGSRLVFLAPIAAGQGSPVEGAVAGWTDLTTNPQFAPVVDLLGQSITGQAFIVDDRGQILVHPDASKVTQTVQLPAGPGPQLLFDTAADGTRQLVYTEPVEGYSWQIVVTEPQRVLDRLAMTIAFRLFGVVSAVGLLAVGAAYFSSRRLTRPLGRMTEVAESIAKGNLELPVPSGGEDEVGRLAAAFERMRRGLKSKLEEMDLLLSASQGLASSFDLTEVMPRILAQIRESTGADVVRLTLVPLSGGVERVESYSEGEDPGGWRRLDSQVLELCRERGRFILENPARARAVLDLSRLEAPMEALIALPILNEETYVGSLWMGYRSPHAFTSDEVHLLSILASQLGVSVANTRLYHRAEQERLRLGAVLEATPDAVIVIDGEGRVGLANPAARSVLKSDGSAVVGKRVEDVLALPELVELVRPGGMGTRTVEVKLEDGRVLSASTSDIEGGASGQWGQVCVLRDVTYYKRIDIMKSEFVSTVSHDLRAPLTLSQGYATMLSMVGDLNEEQKEFVRKILKSVDQMKQLIDNLLDLGRIEAGIGLSLTQVEIEAVVHEVVADHRPQAVNHQISLEVDLAPSLLPVRADATLLRQAIANLVDNAIKYTPSGGRVVVRGSQRDGRQIIQVQDTGVGVAPTDQRRLFERFYRARRRETIGTRGSGLGLAIVKSIAQQHGGDVTVESRLGEGSIFTIDLPMEAVANPIRP